MGRKESFRELDDRESPICHPAPIQLFNSSLYFALLPSASRLLPGAYFCFLPPSTLIIHPCIAAAKSLKILRNLSPCRDHVGEPHGGREALVGCEMRRRQIRSSSRQSLLS